MTGDEPMVVAVDGAGRDDHLQPARKAQLRRSRAVPRAGGVGEFFATAIVLRGAGRAFGAGIDRDMLAAGMPADFLPAHERAYAALEDMDELVVAAVHGHVLGSGLMAALAADLRICSTDATLGLTAARLGLFPAMATFRLPRLIGLGPARRLILSGETVDPAEAHRLGLVDHLVAAERFDEGVAELVARYAALSPAAVAAIKRLTARAFDAPRDAVLAEALPMLAACLAQPDVAAAGTAWTGR